MVDCESLKALDATAARLLRLVDERHEAGDRAGALAAADAADALLLLLDLDGLRARAEA